MFLHPLAGPLLGLLEFLAGLVHPLLRQGLLACPPLGLFLLAALGFQPGLQLGLFAGATFGVLAGLSLGLQPRLALPGLALELGLVSTQARHVRPGRQVHVGDGWLLLVRGRGRRAWIRSGRATALLRQQVPDALGIRDDQDRAAGATVFLALGWQGILETIDLAAAWTAYLEDHGPAD